MTPAAAARLYVERSFRIFPCHATGPWRKSPLTRNGLKDASNDADKIEAWWRHWPNALIGYATGYQSVVLDIDVKNPRANGFDTLSELGFAILPDTPMAHTSSGGLHLHFAVPTPPIGNTCGHRGRGIGDGLDWRGIGGYVILPSPGSGYRWDPAKNFKTTPLAAVPDPSGRASPQG
jgi:Bifunctional DNA primase/polymerase, N-terminal